MAREQAEAAGPIDAFRGFFSLRRDVMVLSLAMFAFSLGFQMTTRFLPEYMIALGASGFVVGLFGTFGNVISAVYPYPGGAISDRLGSRYSLTLFGVLSTLGFVVWLIAPGIGTVALGGLTVQPWIWVFVGLLLAQAWKSFGLGASFAVVKQATDPSRLAAGFASTEVFRRSAFLVGPVLAAVLIGLHPDFTVSFRYALAVAVVFGAVGTVVQHYLYDAGGDSVGDSLESLARIRRDLREMPGPMRPLLIGDTLVRFANGMVYVFFILVVTQFLEVGLEASVSVAGFGYDVSLSPAAFFGYLLGIEMLIALVSMPIAAKGAEYVGLKPVVGLGFVVYAVFPVILINAPASAAAMVAVFAFSGLRFAGLPAHKALIVGPAERGAGGRVTGTYYLVRNTIVIPSAAIGGALWDGLRLPEAILGVSVPGGGVEYWGGNPTVAFGVATVIGLVGTGYFITFGKEFEAYA
ncbi:MFS transporter [Natronomonas sp. F2-12]|jgi:MFS family permease|uniref:MFS transporter n=1 Tax=Natronomonas aquatica TaxID=2841590 RepID=A0A9R1CPB1_9EURY|nr:MFS transporter [Natronomonas aquatica]MCQ4332539.1 MFS transporter [Natronomonas aquatica]